MQGLNLILFSDWSASIASIEAGPVSLWYPLSPTYKGRAVLIPLAVTTPTKSEASPDVPAAADFVAGYEAGSWYGIGAPKGTRSNVVEKLNNEVNAALENASIKARLSELGATAIPGSSIQFETLIARETEKYADVIRSAKIAVK